MVLAVQSANVSTFCCCTVINFRKQNMRDNVGLTVTVQKQKLHLSKVVS